MVHGLYRPLKPRAVCMKKAHANAPLTCSKRFPKPFANETIVNSDGYPEYRRRRTVDGVNVQWGDEGMYDNRWIVPECMLNRPLCHNLLGCIAAYASWYRRGVYCNRKHGSQLP
jgi:hypothetical protein